MPHKSESNAFSARHYLGTARPAKNTGPKKWKSQVWVNRRDSGEVVETIEAEGGTETSAMTNGLKVAKQEAARLAVPKDWKGSPEP